MMPSNSEAIGLDIPAAKRGFCRKSAASRVEPERGNPLMKWKVLGICPRNVCFPDNDKRSEAVNAAVCREWANQRVHAGFSDKYIVCQLRFGRVLDGEGVRTEGEDDIATDFVCER